MTISLLEWQALSFFEVEPTRQDEDVPWACNDVRYEIQRGDLLLSCSLGPAYHDIDLLLTRGGQALYQLVALSVKDIVYERDGEQELLRILISDRDDVRLVVKPFIEIKQSMRDWRELE